MNDTDRYVPYPQRTGESSVVFFTRDLSEKGLLKIYDRISSVLTGKIAVKVHTGEAEGPNIIPRPWVKELMEKKLPGETIVETNTLYPGSRFTTAQHKKTLEVNGWTFCPVDIMDSHGTTDFEIKGGKWFDKISVGKSLPEYDSLLALTHFKGHTMGGFGGSNKNIGIGCADGKKGKGKIHLSLKPNNMLGPNFMERMTESTKGIIDHFGKNVAYINVMRNMSVSCDCEGKGAEPVVTPDVGILASLDICAIDHACMDLIYSLKGGLGKELIERVESRHGLRQLSYMKELGMGNDRYILIDIDHDDKPISQDEAVKDIDCAWESDKYNTFPGRNKKIVIR